jgi:hypothetical protein
MNKEAMVKCFFRRKPKRLCDVCANRFICLTSKWTEDDYLAYVKDIPVFIMNVPNTKEGLAFYKQFKKYLNKERYRAQRYGRAKNRSEKGGCQSHTPINNCDYFGVYLREGALVRRQQQLRYEDSLTDKP